MSYAAGMMDKRVQILARGEATDGEFGVNSEGAEYAKVGCVWAAVDFSRGMKSIREGAYDAYDILMVRMRYHEFVNRECRLVIEGKTYAIQSFNADKRRNTIQITCQELVNL